MKKSLMLLVAIIATILSAQAQYTYGDSYGILSYGESSFSVNSNSTYVSGYTRSDGIYVQGYYRSAPNNTNHDNYSTSGNYNPFTGSVGSRAKDYSPEAYNYGSGQTIYTGPRGGQYYINSNGNKTYVPKRR